MITNKKYEVVETIGKLTRDPTSFGYQFSIEQLEVENYDFNFKPYQGKRVKVIIIIGED